MSKITNVGFFAFILIGFSFCTEPGKQKIPPLVYEGMSATELRQNLGEPISIDSSGSVFNPEKRKKIKLEKWKYDKRTVLLMNDTVKDSNID